MPTEPSDVVELAETVSDLLRGVAGWLLIGLGIAALLSGTGGLVQSAGPGDAAVPLVVLLSGAVLLGSGVVVTPRFRRRLDRRREPSRFGRVRTVDGRRRSPAEGTGERCVGCGAETTAGLVRRYREEYCVAGVPVRTTSEGYNHYCPTCATEERPVASRSTDGDPVAEASPMAETE